MKNLIKVISVAALVSIMSCSDQNIESKREGLAPFREEEQAQSPEEMVPVKEHDYESGFTKGHQIRPDGKYPVQDKDNAD